MLKLILILLVGLLFESAGVVLLKKGMMRIGDVNRSHVPEILRVVKSGATSPQILLGVFFEALFFLCLLILMSKSDISFLWPLTALELCFRHLRRDYFPGRKCFHRPLGRRGSHCDRRRLHQLQRTRRKKPGLRFQHGRQAQESDSSDFVQHAGELRRRELDLFLEAPAARRFSRAISQPPRPVSSNPSLNPVSPTH